MQCASVGVGATPSKMQAAEIRDSFEALKTNSTEAADCALADVAPQDAQGYAALSCCFPKAANLREFAKSATADEDLLTLSAQQRVQAFFGQLFDLEQFTGVWKPKI